MYILENVEILVDIIIYIYILYVVYVKYCLKYIV